MNPFYVVFLKFILNPFKFIYINNKFKSIYI
jgi:hypothetical protein